MYKIQHQIGINKPVTEVYRAITTLDGISNWWTLAKNSCQIGEILELHFYNNENLKTDSGFIMKMEILQSQKNKLVEWKSIAGAEEWIDTKIKFELQVTEKQILIEFSHSGWKKDNSFFRHCNTKWAAFLISLKKYLETGKGMPYPNDLRIIEF